MASVAGSYLILRGWPDAPSLLLRSCMAVALLVLGLAVWGIRRDPRRLRLVSLRRAGWSDYLALGASVVFAEACFVVLTSSLAAPSQMVADEVAEVWLEVVEGEESSTEETEVDFEASGSGDWLFKPSLERSLPKRSNHKPSNKPEVFIQLERAEDASRLLSSRIHLRSFAFTRFDGVTWSTSPTVKRDLVGPVRFDVPLGLALLDLGEPIRHRVFHGVNPTGQNIFTALSGVSSSDVERLTQLGEAIYLLPDLQDETDGYQYEATSTPIHFTDLINSVLTPAEAKPEEVKIPDGLVLALDQTAESFRHEQGLGAQLVALRSYLQDHYDYSLETKNIRNDNPLKNFLYEEKRGYCEHFATAAAMLCRTLGVPSRIAYGWSGGRLYASQNMFVFRAKDAHAWTEIKLKGYGWVVFDTTPPDDDATPETHAAPESETAPDPQEVLAEQHQQRLDRQGGGDAFLASLEIKKGPLFAALAVAGLCFLGFVLMRYLQRPQTDAEGRPLITPTPAYMTHFKQTCASLGHPIPFGRTLRQHVEMLQDTEEVPGFLEELLDYHYGILYGGQQKDKAVEKSLSRKITQWRKAASREY